MRLRVVVGSVRQRRAISRKPANTARPHEEAQAQQGARLRAQPVQHLPILQQQVSALTRELAETSLKSVFG